MASLFSNRTYWEYAVDGDYDINSMTIGPLDPDIGEQIVTGSIDGLLSIFRPLTKGRNNSDDLLLQHRFPDPILQVSIVGTHGENSLAVLHPKSMGLYSLYRSADAAAESDGVYTTSLASTHALNRTSTIKLTRNAVNMSVIATDPLSVAVLTIDGQLIVHSAEYGQRAFPLGPSFILPGPMVTTATTLILADPACTIHAFPTEQLTPAPDAPFPDPVWTRSVEDDVLLLRTTPADKLRAAEIIAVLPTYILIISGTNGMVTASEHLPALVGVGGEAGPADVRVINWGKDGYNIVLTMADGQVYVYRRSRGGAANLTLLWRTKITLNTGDASVASTVYPIDRDALQATLATVTAQGRLTVDVLGTTPRTEEPKAETIDQEVYDQLDEQRRAMEAQLKAEAPAVGIIPTVTANMTIDDGVANVDISVGLEANATATFRTAGLTISWAGAARPNPPMALLEPMEMAPGEVMTTTVSASIDPSAIPPNAEVRAGVSGEFATADSTHPVACWIGATVDPWAGVTIEPKPVGLRRAALDVVLVTDEEVPLLTVLDAQLTGDARKAAEAKNAVTIRMSETSRLTIRGRVDRSEGQGKYKLIATSWEAAVFGLFIMKSAAPDARVDRTDKATLAKALDPAIINAPLTALIDAHHRLQAASTECHKWRGAMRRLSRKLVALTKERRPEEDSGLGLCSDAIATGLAKATETEEAARTEYERAAGTAGAALTVYVALIGRVFVDAGEKWSDTITNHCLLPTLCSGDEEWPELVETSLRFLVRRVLSVPPKPGPIQPRDRPVDADTLVSLLGVVAECLDAAER